MIENHAKQNSKNRISENSAYAHLILTHSRDIKDYRGVISTGRFRKVNSFSIWHASQKYDHWIVNLLGQDINDVRKRLARQYSHMLFNIEPYTLGDKLTPKTAGATPFADTEIDSVSGNARVWVRFHSDVPKKHADEIMRTEFPGQLGPSSEDNVVITNLEKISTLSRRQEISHISEYTAPTVLINSSRNAVNLSREQPIDTSYAYPNYAWCNEKCAYSSTYYGRGVWVAIYDTGVDSTGDSTTVSDFKEVDSVGAIRLRRADSTVYWEPPNNLRGPIMHGTHVAGIIGGNGWNSTLQGKPRYLWRGIAPKSLLSSRDISYGGWHGHVNNHSHVFGFLGFYNPADHAADETVYDHRITHTQIISSGNGGLHRSNGVEQRGYYSLLANGKNPIIVGSTHKDTALRSSFSSMGPTRDGRIKPDVVAPGSSYGFPQKDPYRLKVDIDYIRFIRSNGTIAKSFEFSASTEGWGNGWGTDNFTVSGGTLKFDSWNHYSDIANTSVSGYTSNPDDSIVVGYRMRHPQIPGRVNKIVSGFGWNGSSGSMVRFALPTPDTTSFQTYRARLRDLRNPPYSSGQTYGAYTWPTGSNISISQMSLHIAQDTSPMVYSTNLKGVNYPPYFYDHGTSMAAPVVSGIVALMLEKWKTEVVPGADLHTQGPWNSTVKAILVHTATDLVKEAPDGGELGGGHAGEAQLQVNPDLCSPAGGVYGAACTREIVWNSFVKYYKGPDYATGYGLVNAEKALDYTDDTYLLQDSVEHADEHTFTFRVPQNNWGKLRLTLAWDDVPGNPLGPLYLPRLVNDLDLVVESPSGAIHYPWKLDPLPQDTANLPPVNGIDPIESFDVQEAYKGINSADNVEVVDVEPSGALETGVWKVIIKGTSVTGGDLIQDFSLVSDYKLTKM